MSINHHLATIDGIFGKPVASHNKEFIVELIRRIEALEADNRDLKAKVDTIWEGDEF